MRVGRICAQPVVTVCANATLMEVAQLMSETHADAVVVIASPVDRPTAIGMVTDQDIVRAQREGVADLSQLRVADVLSRDPLVLNEEETVENAIRYLRARKVRHAPVIGSGGTLCGLISLDDLLSQNSAWL